jgi:hypothetical protein
MFDLTRMCIFIFVLLSIVVAMIAGQSSAQNPVLVTQVVAGNGVTGYNGENVVATSAQLYSPFAVSGDSVLGVYYVADGPRIRKISFSLSQTLVSTFAGSGPSTFGVFNEGCQATALNCYIGNAVSLWVDSLHNVYFYDALYQKIKKINYADGTVTTFIGSGSTIYNGENLPATATNVYYAIAMWGDSVGNIYFSESNNHRVRKYLAATGTVITFAGTGTTAFNGDGIPPTAANLYSPQGVYGDANGNVYITSTSQHRIRVVNSVSGLISTFAGTGLTCYNGDGIPAPQALLCSPVGLYIDNFAGGVYFIDSGNVRLRMVSMGTNYIYTLVGTGNLGFAGDGGPGASATLFARSVWGWGNGDGTLFLADSSSKRIRMLDVNGIISRLAGSNFAFNGDGLPATSTQLYYPSNVWISSTGVMYVADSQNYRIRKLVPGSGGFTTVVGTGINGNSGTNQAGTLHYLSQVYALWGDTNGFLYFFNNYYIERYNPGTGEITAIIGTGSCCDNGMDNTPALTTYLDYVRGIHGDGLGIFLFSYCSFFSFRCLQETFCSLILVIMLSVIIVS